MAKQQDEALDALLDSALEDFVNEEQTTQLPQSPTTTSPSPSPSSSSPSPSSSSIVQPTPLSPTTPSSSSSSATSSSIPRDEEQLSQQFAAEMSKLMKDLQEGNFEKTLEEMAKTMGMPPAAAADARGGDQFEDNIANTLKMLATSAQNLENPPAGGNPDQDNPALMDKMLEQFENNTEFQSAMEGMVQQLISKDVLYEPMRDLREKYPNWLKENASKLNEEDHRKYLKQYEYVQKICVVYESPGDYFQEVVQLMQEMAEYGQPPPDIIKELAPGVQFGTDGLPILPGSANSNDGNACSVM